MALAAGNVRSAGGSLALEWREWLGPGRSLMQWRMMRRMEASIQGYKSLIITSQWEVI